MTVAPGWRRLFRLPHSGRRIEQELDDELAFHVAMREEKLRALGRSPERARAEALSRFGDSGRVRDECLIIDRQYAREVRLMEWLHSTLSDVRYALRTLRRAPAFTVVAAITLALGVGASTAMFSLVNGILLRPLPYQEPQRVVRLMQSYPEKGLDSWTLSQQNLVMYRDQASDFSAFAGYTRRGVTMLGNGPAERLIVLRVTGDFFKVLGVPPLAGTTFGRDEDRPNGAAVTVLSYGFWQNRFGGDKSVIGRTLDIDGVPTRVLGVMPAGFTFPRPDVQMYLPVGLDPSHRFGWFLTGIGRLKPGVSVAHAERQTTGIMWTWAREQPDLLSLTSIQPERTKMRTLVVPLQEALTGEVARPLVVLQIAVVLLLLIAIANIATLISSRSAARNSEMAVRTALGATGRRVARQLVTESVVLALLRGTLGVALAVLAVRAFTRWSAASLPRIEAVTIDWRVLGFALVISIVSGVLFGLSPAIHVARSKRLTDDLTGTQKQSVRGSARRLNDLLIVAQLALSVVLLISAGLVLKSFQRLVQTDLGFDPRGVTAVSIALPPQKYPTRAQAAVATTALIGRVRTLPGVQSVAAAWYLPFSGSTNTDGFLVEGHPAPPDGGSEGQAIQVPVTPGFFDVMRIPLRAGRDISDGDRQNTLPVVVVDEALIHRYWTPTEAIGKRMRFTGDTTWNTIVGVVATVRDEDVADAGRPHTYQPFAQQPSARPTLAIRSAGDPSTVIAEVRRAIAELEPIAPLSNVQPLTNVVAQALDSRRLTELLLTGFALLAVTLAAVGIYGVMTLYVSNRNREFGIRLAIGAEPVSLVRLVMRDGLRLAVLGVGLGVLGGLAATRWLRTLLYDVSPTDPVIFVSLAIGLLGVAVLSCYTPARRAARADPLSALRGG
jgi:predicted permease